MKASSDMTDSSSTMWVLGPSLPTLVLYAPP
jgi:hypothetical protein